MAINTCEAVDFPDFSLSSNVFMSSRSFDYAVGTGGVKGDIKSLGLGITGTYKNFYVDVSGEKNITASEESATNLLPSNLSTDIVKFNRSDFTTSLGYAVNESISTFMGYKYGKTTITALPPSPFVGNAISLKGQGVFIGAGGGWQVKNWGFVSFSAAYAKMQAIYQDPLVGTSHGDAAGTSLGIKWKAPLTERLYYDLSMLHHDYRYEKFDKFNQKITEEILSFRVGISYHF